VHLDLVDRGHDAGLGHDAVEVGRLEVRDADGGGAAVGDELGQGLPRGDEVAVVQRRQRPVDEEEVDPVQVQRRQGRVEGAAGVVGPVEAVVELAGDVELVAGDAGGLDRLADALLVLVHLRGVDVAVADLECRGHRLGGLLRRHLEDPEAELRDGRLVVEGDRGNGHGGHDNAQPLAIPVRGTSYAGPAGPVSLRTLGQGGGAGEGAPGAHPQAARGEKVRCPGNRSDQTFVEPGEQS